MKQLLSSALLVAVVFFGCSSDRGARAKEQSLYVQNASSGTFNGKELTLNGVSGTLYFAEEVNTATDSIDLGEYVQGWSDGSRAKASAARATVTILSSGADRDAVVELTNPRIVGNDLVYKVRVIQGSLPNEFGPVALFIEAQQ